MRKIIVLFLAIVSCMSFSACGNKTVLYKLGDTVESDIMKITLNKAQFAFALDNNIENDFGAPKEYNAEEDNQNPYVASKGHTLVSFTFTAENLDRNEIELSGTFNPEFVTVKYNDEEYNNRDNVYFIAKGDNILFLEEDTSDELQLDSGTVMIYRAYMDIPIEVSNLNDTFELTFHLPNSQGKTQDFTFSVTAEDRNNYVEPEITLDSAIEHFKLPRGQEYVVSHSGEYERLNDNQIAALINDQEHSYIESATSTSVASTGKYVESNGILQRRQVDPSFNFLDYNWQIGGDKLILTLQLLDYTVAYDVYKINDTGYYLLNSGDNRSFLIK